jgi:hypothetical protein
MAYLLVGRAHVNFEVSAHAFVPRFGIPVLNEPLSYICRLYLPSP